MTPCKSDTPTFVDNNGKTWGQALWTRVLVLIYIYRIDTYIVQSYIYLAETIINFKQQYTFKFYEYTFKQQQAQTTKYFEVEATKQSVATFKLFFVDAINWTLLCLFLLASLE